MREKVTIAPKDRQLIAATRRTRGEAAARRLQDVIVRRAAGAAASRQHEREKMLRDDGRDWSWPPPWLLRSN